MASKQAERELVTMANHYNWWIHKWRDVQVCNNTVTCSQCGHGQRCGSLIFMTDREQGVPEESIVDYLMFLGHVPVWVECKGKPGETRYSFNDLKPKQEDFLISFYSRNVASAMFITLGTKVPDRFAWLISIKPFMEAINEAKEAGMKSLPYKATNRKADIYNMDIFEDWKLEWERGIGWKLPPEHMIVKKLPWVVSLPSLRAGL